MLTAGDIYAAGTDKPETFDVIRYTGSADYSLAVANSRRRAVAEQERSTSPQITDPYLRRSRSCRHRPTWPASTPPT